MCTSALVMEGEYNLPLRSLPKKLHRERIDTCSCWFLMTKASLTVSSWALQRALTTFPMLLENKVRTIC